MTDRTSTPGEADRRSLVDRSGRPDFIERVLGRTPRPLPLDRPLAELATERVLVTGAAGSIGTAILTPLEEAGAQTLATDVDELDVTERPSIASVFDAFRPTVIFHLAGAKHAPDGEVDPLEVLEVNGRGTANVIRAAKSAGARVVTASTCKACDPETAYGASKLLAERITLAAGERVSRFYNVVESSGNVFEIWDALPRDAALPTTPCRRFFLSLEEAIALTLWAAVVEPGRYTVNPGPPRFMAEVARALFPGREVEPVPPRRGDRLEEPRTAESERLTTVTGTLERVWSMHDAGFQQSIEVAHAGAAEQPGTPAEL